MTIAATTWYDEQTENSDSLTSKTAAHFQQTYSKKKRKRWTKQKIPSCPPLARQGSIRPRGVSYPDVLPSRWNLIGLVNGQIFSSYHLASIP